MAYSLKDRLLDPLNTSRYGLSGIPGPTFENLGQKYTSEIQARTTLPISNTLAKSQDLITGRVSTQIPGYAYFTRNTQLAFGPSGAGKPAPWGPYSSKGPAEGKY